LTSDSSRPRLTFYDDATGERIELSATTINNWACKTANLITLECGLAPGSRIRLQLPRHWLLAVWVLACDLTGMEVDDGSQLGEVVDLAVVGPNDVGGDDETSLINLINADEIFACSLAPMGRPFTTALPIGIRDFTADVRLMPDQAGPFTSPGQLGERATERAAHLRLARGDRPMALSTMSGAAEAPMPVAQLVDQWLAPLAADAGVVWVRNPSPSACVTRWGSEQVTHAFSPVPAGIEVPDTIRML
jgi:uncharacterized protein (TIGR03089 family)